MDKETGRTGLPGASPLSSKKKEEDLRAMVVSGHEVPEERRCQLGHCDIINPTSNDTRKHDLTLAAEAVGEARTFW